MHDSGQAAAAPVSAQSESPDVPGVSQEIQASESASSSAQPPTSSPPCARLRFRGDNRDHPACVYDVSCDSGHILCLTCRSWHRTAETLETHTCGIKHQKKSRAMVESLSQEQVADLVVKNRSLPIPSQEERIISSS